VRRWPGGTSLATCGVAIVLGCGTGHGGAVPGDDGGGTGPRDGSAGSTAGMADGGPRDSASGDSSGGPDATAGDEGTSCASGPTCKGSVSYDCRGDVVTSTDCSSLTPPQVCASGLGCVACQPGTGTCNGNTGTACNAAGTGTVTTSCDPLLGEACNPTTGQCFGDCARLGASYIGCEYFAVSMANQTLDQATFDFSVSVSNTTTNPASIVIRGPNAFQQTFTLGGGAIQNYVLPWVPALSMAGTTTLVAGGAYHIESTEPVTVYQFNAYEYEIDETCGSDPNPTPPCRSYTNDASLLIPVNAMTGNYRVVAGATWASLDVGQEFPGAVDIVATVDGTQVVYATPGGNAIQPGAGLTSTGGMVTLDQGDVLQIAAAGDATEVAFGSDQTGALVTASQPVEVLGGSDCSDMPSDLYACDHLEQINFPLETLSRDYLVTLPFNQNGTPRQYVKIVGTVDGTGLSTDPAQASVPAALDAGEVVVFEATQDFHLTATQPVAVGQFMEGAYAFGPNCSQFGLASAPDCGDPSMSMAVATAQFRESYQFIAPPSYSENWVNVIAVGGVAVSVDGEDVTGFVAIGSSGYFVAHVPLCGNGGACSGVHQVTSARPFGIEVYGYGYFTSYMYPGGLNLTR
jgi:hypothetical protein